jgi:aerobic C4-dicarboxylate transport protein
MKRLHHHLYFWVLAAIVVGAGIGFLDPELGVTLKPVSDAFIALVKMLIGPIVFCTIVLGITGAGDMKKVGRVGLRTIVYFEIVSTIALFIGLIVGNVFKPGDGFHVKLRSLDSGAVANYAQAAHDESLSGFFLSLIPKTFADAFSGDGSLLQVLVVAILFGYALNKMGRNGSSVHKFIEQAAGIFFAMVNAVMKLAPLGAGAAMAFTVGKYGIEALKPLAAVMGLFYLTCAIFVFVVLGAIAKAANFSIWKFLKYIREEILIVLGTSSSESVLAPLMEKLENAGVSKGVTGLVVPAGYSFNLDGTNIYLTLATLFIAQALDIDLTWSQQALIFAVALLTSKGASGVTGAGFITLAATLAVVPDIPVAGLALILGIDRFMSEARAITNLIGNGVAAIVMAKWEKDLDEKAFKKALT